MVSGPSTVILTCKLDKWVEAAILWDVFNIILRQPYATFDKTAHVLIARRAEIGNIIREANTRCQGSIYYVSQQMGHSLASCAGLDSLHIVLEGARQ